MITDDQADLVVQRLQELFARGEAQFGQARLAELVTIGQTPAGELPEDDPRSLAEMVWWRDVLDVIADQVAQPVEDFNARARAAQEQHGVTRPQDLPADVLVPLEAEAHRALRMRDAAKAFGFEL